jgi:hypothetical protein
MVSQNTELIKQLLALKRRKKKEDLLLARKKSVLQMGLEPMTLGLLDPRSNQLSYKSCALAIKKCGYIG